MVTNKKQYAKEYYQKHKEEYIQHIKNFGGSKYGSR